MNLCVFTGRPTKNPEVRYSDGKISTAKYRLAVPRGFKNKDQEYLTDFFNVVAFGNAATYAERYVRQGKRLELTCRATEGTYKNKDGISIAYTEFVAIEQKLIDWDSNSNSNSSQETDNSSFSTMPDDINFDSMAFNN